MTPFTFSTITFLYLCAFAIITPSLAAQDDIQQRSPLGKSSSKVKSPKPVVPPKAATSKAKPPPVVATSKAAAPPKATTSKAKPPPAVATSKAVAPPKATTSKAKPPPVTTSKAVAPPKATTSKAKPPPATTSKAVAPPKATTSKAKPPPVTTSKAVAPPKATTSKAKPPPVTTSKAVVPPTSKAKASSVAATSKPVTQSSSASKVTSSATGKSTAVSSAKTVSHSSSTVSHTATAANATGTACTLKRAGAAGAGAVAQCSRPDGEDGSGGCDPCDDGCTTNKRRSSSLGDDDDIQIVYGNETVPFWPGHSLRMRLIPRAPPQLEFDCTPTTNIPEVCQNMCFGQSCAGHPAILTRSTNKALCQAARKTNSCGVTNPNRCSTRFSPPAAQGQSCDEYPFASTLEAQNAQGGIASTRCVPAGQNSSQGGKISSFYRTLGGGNQFEVVLTGKGAAGAVGYCAANPVCTKTNGQL